MRIHTPATRFSGAGRLVESCQALLRSLADTLAIKPARPLPDDSDTSAEIGLLQALKIKKNDPYA